MIILKIFILLSIVVVLSLFTSTIYAQEENATASEEPKFLALQHAQSGSISEINETSYSLELNDVSDKTILFSNRPDRIVKSISTNDFIGNWSVGEDSFAQDAPNAVLVVDDLQEQETAIIELFNPVNDIEKNTLKYDVALGDATSLELSTNFGKSTLIIDNNKISWEETFSLYAGRK